jgi:hypothetical protein
MSQRGRIIASYADALEAMRRLSTGISDWSAPTPCGRWSLLELAGHLLAIARYWHRLLDGAESERPNADLPRGPALAAMNARDLLGLPETTGSQRMGRFMEQAAVHVQRLERSNWELTLGDWSGLGSLTIGQHSGVAIGEWHVHAWDIARSIGEEHRPCDAPVVAAGNRVLRDLPEEDDPWLAVLAGYGRDVHWDAKRASPEQTSTRDA